MALQTAGPCRCLFGSTAVLAHFPGFRRHGKANVPLGCYRLWSWFLFIQLLFWMFVRTSEGPGDHIISRMKTEGLLMVLLSTLQIANFSLQGLPADCSLLSCSSIALQLSDFRHIHLLWPVPSPFYEVANSCHFPLGTVFFSSTSFSKEMNQSLSGDQWSC